MWIYGSVELKMKLVYITGKVWDGEDPPENWKNGIVVPLYKKGEVNNVNNYRGNTLLSTAYKIF